MRRALALSLPAALAGCAASMHPDFENVYHRHEVPAELEAAVRDAFRRFGLVGADITRDRLGRLQLAGRYADEAEVDRAFVIVQNIVGLQATSMVYPADVREKAWEREASQAFERFVERQRAAARAKADAARSGEARKFALLVGVSRFQDARLPRLPGAAKDVGTLEALLRGDGGFRPSEVELLRDQQATRDAIRARLDRLVEAPGPDDTVFVYVASHGLQPVPDPRGTDVRKYPVLAFDSRTTSPVAMYESALHDTDLIAVVRGSRARNVVVVLDTCYSGNVFTGLGELQLGGAAAARWLSQVNAGTPERDGLGSRTIRVRWTPPASGRPQAAARGDAAGGRVSVLSASGPGEESIESAGVLPAPSGRRFDGGLFTQSFAEGLRLHRGDVGRAFGYAQAFVSLFAREKTGGRGRQTPQMLFRPEDASINLFARG